jgi:hypothetical protein
LVSKERQECTGEEIPKRGKQSGKKNRFRSGIWTQFERREREAEESFATRVEERKINDRVEDY